VVFKRFGLPDGYDETRPADYTADPVPAPAEAATAAKTATAAAPAVEDDATVVFEIPGSLAVRRRSGERPLRRR
jgi:hypothetical protein